MSQANRRLHPYLSYPEFRSRHLLPYQEYVRFLISHRVKDKDVFGGNVYSLFILSQVRLLNMHALLVVTTNFVGLESAVPPPHIHPYLAPTWVLSPS